MAIRISNEKNFYRTDYKKHMKLFATFEIPKKNVGDNGSRFTSEEFAIFCLLNGRVHKKIITLPQMEQRKKCKIVQIRI